MEFVPSFEEFSALSGEARVVPVRADFLFDSDTAVTAYHKLATPPFGFLLESVVGGEKWARYSFLGTEPAAAWRLRGKEVSWWEPASGWSSLGEMADPLSDLDRRLQERTPAEVPGLPRFWGGAVGYFGYDVVRQMERLPERTQDDLGLPEALVVFTDVVLAIDNLLGRAMAIRGVQVEEGMSEEGLRALYQESCQRIAGVVQRLREGTAPPPVTLRREPTADPELRSTMSREAFEAAVERIREYILAGDAFQVVLSQRLEVELTGTPFELYRALRSLNPSPYLYFLELDGVTLVGASPEVLVRVEDDILTVRPIAGTRKRGATPEEDDSLEADLLADEKELAEHRMLVDLGRNDVGRVAEFGTVTVPELMAVERYSHVMHLCSQVEGRLKSGLSALDALRAAFPAGTVSGAPKIRAMEIIEELEPVRRGPYAGAVGYVGFGGNAMDTAIAIRTVLVTEGRAYVQAGAGVVVDSVPASEYEETLNKARALLRASAMVIPASASTVPPRKGGPEDPPQPDPPS